MNNNDKTGTELFNAEGISIPDEKRYRLPLLLQLARQVASFAPECEICQSLQVQIAQLGASLEKRYLMTRQSLKEYLGVIQNITRHLKRSHGLVEERHYVKRCVLASLTFGILLVLLGVILLNFGIALMALNIALIALIGRVVFSYTIGYFLDRRAKKMGRVL